MSKYFFISSFLLCIGTMLSAQIHRNNEKFCSDTIFLNDQKKDAFYIVSLVVVLDSVVVVGEYDEEYYTYEIQGHFHDPNLKCLDTIVNCKLAKIMFIVKDNAIYFCKDDADSDIHIDLNTHRNDSLNLIARSPFSYFGFMNSSIKARYIPKYCLFSTVDISFSSSLLFKRIIYEYGVGITLIELKQTCDFGNVTFFRE